MLAHSFSTVRRHFRTFCDMAVNDSEPILITRERGENVVLMSEAQYSNLLENLYVRSDPAYYNELLQSIDHLKKGNGRIRELIQE